MFRKIIVEEEERRMADSAEYRASILQQEQKALKLFVILIAAAVALLAVETFEVVSFPKWVSGAIGGLVAVAIVRIFESRQKVGKIKRIETLAPDG